MRTVLALAPLAIVLGIPVTTHAQDAPKTGIVMAYPTSVGILWHASDKVALRPEFSISGVSSTLTSAQNTTDTSGVGFGVGISALFYVHKDDNLRTYIVPRFVYSHSSTSTSTSIGFDVPDVGSDTYGGSGAFGAQYGLGKRFAVFGELGFEFDHRTTDPSASGGKLTGSTWGLRSGVGVIFYP